MTKERSVALFGFVISHMRLIRRQMPKEILSDKKHHEFK